MGYDLCKQCDALVADAQLRSKEHTVELCRKCWASVMASIGTGPGKTMKIPKWRSAGGSDLVPVVGPED